MELKFQEKKLTCLQTLLRKTQSQEQTQELRVSDGMPDVGSVLGAWGQVILRSKEWNGDALMISGGTMVSVQYIPEQGGTVQTLESWIPFQQRWTLPQEQRDGKMLVQCSLKSVDARSTSARKLMLRATVSVLLHAFVQEEKEYYVPDSVPEDVQLHTAVYPVLLPVEVGEKAFTLEESLPYPDRGIPPEKLIASFLQPEVTEWRLLADKLVFRGTALMSVLWEGEDGTLGAWDFTIPFSQYSELDADHGEDAHVVCWPVVTALEAELAQDRIQVKLGIVCQYVLQNRPLITVVEDAYAPCRTVQLHRKPLCLPGILESKEQVLQLHGSCPSGDTGFLKTMLLPQRIECRKQEDDAVVEISVRMQALCTDGAGEQHMHGLHWEDSVRMPMGENCTLETSLWPVGLVQGSIMSGNLQLQGQLRLQMDTVMDTELPMVTGLEIGELEEPDPNRPSIILRRAGNRSLWEIAKESGAILQDIRDANDLDGEPQSDQMLLIPIR